LKQLAGPGIPTITYGADGEGRASTATASTGPNPVTSTAYNLYTSPPQLKVTLGSNDSDVFNFDPNTFRLNKYQFNIGSQAVTGTLGWNANGSLGSLNITDPFSSANTQNCSYAADDLSRISQVNCGTIWGQNFSYDPFGNIQKTKISGTGASTFAPTYQTSPSITNRVSQVSGVNATYDANGNSTNDTFRTFTWDAENRPVTIGSVGLIYDALGRMVEQNVSGTNSEIVYSPASVKLALMNGTTLIKAFVPLTGGLTAVYTSSGLAYYRHTDHLGSSRFASSPTQTMYSDTAYSPFGEPYASSGAIDNSFTGQNQDTLAGLYDFLYREYDPNQARWTSPDPAGLASVSLANPQSWNRYSYVLNNPLNAVDPLGLDCVYLNNAGNGIEWVDQNSNAGECAQNGGAWANGTVNNVQFDPNSNDVLLGYWTGNVDSSGNISNLQNNQVTATPGQLGPGDQIYAFAADLNQWNVMNNTLKMFGAGAVIGATGGAACYYLCPTATVTTLGATVGGTLGPAAADPRLQNFINMLFQATDQMPGGTAGAVRSEIRTGELLSQAGHSIKAEQIINGLQKLVNSGTLSQADTATAKSLIEDLRGALSTSPWMR
jgi:RHS repeat-associated protein